MAFPNSSRPARVIPSLFDRLCPPEPADSGQVEYLSWTEGKETPGLSEAHFREGVLRDLEHLFNAMSPLGMLSADTLKRYPNVAGSVLNYGLRNIFGTVVEDIGRVERQVADALARFEPRLAVNRQSLRATSEGRLVEIELDGVLLILQAQRHLKIRTDLETLASRLVVQSRG